MKPATMLVAVMVLFGLCLAAVEAQAISRYKSTSMSCASIHGVVATEGAVILRWTQPPDIQRFDRFVQHSGFCDAGERAVRSSVPSADYQFCPVNRCRQCERNRLGFFRLRCR